MNRLNNRTLAAIVALLTLGGAVLFGVLNAPEGLGAEEGKSDEFTGTKLKGTTPAQWRLVWERDPAREATVAWTTAQKPEQSLVLYDTESRGGKLHEYAHKAEATVGRYDDRDWKLYYNTAELAGLEPSTTYWFVMMSDGEISREFHFITGPEGDAEFKLLYGGDSRSDRDGRRTMNRRMSKLLQEDPEILGLAHGGDYVSDGDDMDDWVEWLTDHELTVTEDGRMLPLIPARGNHEDDGPHYDEIFNTPGEEGGNFYATKIGDEFLLINLNTNISHGGQQADFLETVLADNTAVRWQLANYHRPAFPAVKKPGDALEHWVPLFEKYDLDVALESDGHTLKRTCAVRNGKPDQTGVVYIGEGGLGVRQRTPDNDRWYFKGGVTASALHVQKLTVTKEELKVESILHDGTVKDTFTAKPRERQ